MGLTLEEKKKKYKIGIWTVLDFLGIEVLTSKPDFYIHCQNCHDGSGRKTLNIDIEKEVFRCPRCGISGGYLDLFTLYYYGHVVSHYNRNQMIEDMKKTDGFDPSSFKRSREEFKIQIKPEEPLLPIEERSIGNNKLLSYCDLSSKDFQDLERRGLSRKAISMLNYKTTPMFTDKIPLKLREDGINLKGIPGFFRDEVSSKWDMKKFAGYFIPYRDINKNIEGFQIRTNSKEFKYIWFSSKGLTSGSGAKAWSHFANTFSSNGVNENPSKATKVIITEGGLKADIINYFTGIPTIGIPGVNALEGLSNVISKLPNNIKVFTAFDMDFVSNKHVKRAYNEMLKMISANYSVSMLKWDDEYNGVDAKGLDDYLLELSKEINFFEGREHLLD